MDPNTLVRHGVIGPDADPEMGDWIAGRRPDPDEIRYSPRRSCGVTRMAS